jgi:hypothetical protein
MMSIWGAARCSGASALWQVGLVERDLEPRPRHDRAPLPTSRAGRSREGWMKGHHVSSFSARTREADSLFVVKHTTKNDQKQLRSGRMRQFVVLDMIE